MVTNPAQKEVVSYITRKTKSLVDIEHNKVSYDHQTCIDSFNSRKGSFKEGHKVAILSKNKIKQAKDILSSVSVVYVN